MGLYSLAVPAPLPSGPERHDTPSSLGYSLQKVGQAGPVTECPSTECPARTLVAAAARGRRHTDSSQQVTRVPARYSASEGALGTQGGLGSS